MSQLLGPEKMVLQIFYRALDQLNKTAVDNAVGGSLVKLSYNMDTNLLKEITKKNQGWHTQVTEVAKRSPTTSYIDKDQRKIDEEREENMEKMIMQLELLTKHVMVAPTKMVNVMASKGYAKEEAKSLDGEIRYLANYPVGSRPTYQR